MRRTLPRISAKTNFCSADEGEGGGSQFYGGYEREEGVAEGRNKTERPEKRK